MTGSTLLVLFLGLLLGLAVGAGVGLVLARGQTRTDVALAAGELARTRTEAERFRAEVERFRADAAQAHAATAQARVETAEVRQGAAEDTAAVARVQAQVAAVTAQRDAAVARVQEISADRESMIAQFKVLSNETAERQGKSVDAVAAQRLQATEQLLAPVTASLHRFESRLTEVEKERKAMSADLQGHVRSVRETGDSLRRETQALVTALRKPQVRGAWGETQLKRVVELAGLVERCDFDLQVTASIDGTVVRPDLRVNLAEGKHLFVDSKVPLSAFLEAAESDDADQQAAHLARFARHVRKHVDDLSGKQYWKAAESPEFVVLFLPSEAFFAAALDQLPDLYEYAAARNVVLATPTTLIGMLRAVSYGWKQAALAETAAEVSHLGRDLYERLGTMGNKLDKLGRSITASVKAYNETVATVETRVLVSARRLRDLKVSDQQLDPLAGVEQTTRQIQAPELVEDAVRVQPLIGRSRRTLALPESEALFRADPDVDDLVAADDAAGRSDEAHRDTGS